MTEKLALLGGSPVRSKAKAFPKWPFASPLDASRLQTVLESGNWGGYPFPNRFATEFQNAFAAYHGAKYACCVTNGTAAITIALKAAGIVAGDEVIVPAYTWDGTATAVLDAGAIPVFVDVDPDTYCLDVSKITVTPRTRAIVPVHLAMRFTDMTALRALARRHNLAIVEDCAHVHGGEYLGEGAGSMGDLGTFSFQSSKLMTAGEGGIILTSREDCYELVQTLVNCGRAGSTGYVPARRPTGGNYRMTEFQTAILLGQLEMLPDLARQRAAQAARLDEALAAIPGISPLPPQRAITRLPVYNYVFRLHESGISRDLFCAAVEAEGVPCDGRFYEPVYRSDLFGPSAEEFPQIAGIDYRRNFDCPIAVRAAYHESVWLPQFVLLDPADAGDVVDAIAKVACNLDGLRTADPTLAGVKAMSRAERPRVERKNY
ncbi:MAG: DegT/DnrJ/EryC1/StrS family aminotransferase [Acidobacteria bacterium]|nr:DegT/DnrJ/EryC1/StrS family aminotransferase [Acidobacteriota bacterium]